MSNGFSNYYSVTWFVGQKLADNIEVVLEDKSRKLGYFVTDGLIKYVLVFSPDEGDVWYVHEALRVDNAIVKTSKNALRRNYDKSSPLYQRIIAAIVHQAISEE